MKNSPHVIPYQGSKRKIAKDILKHIQDLDINTFYEPFAGSAALTISAAQNSLAKNFVIGDKFETIIDLHHLIINEPENAAKLYSDIWEAQLEAPYEYFLEIREKFNLDRDPVKLLYLIARCVKNAIRFNSNGMFNQSPDKRRLGTKPATMEKNIKAVSSLLKGKTELFSGDFTEITRNATANDIIYMDPPWQGTSTKKDTRYAYVLELESLLNEMELLNSKNIPFLLSFDGVCGDKSYGNELPEELNLTKIGIDAGRSSQATLLGRTDKTIESLYLSPALSDKIF